jgi:hypothetical protein
MAVRFRSAALIIASALSAGCFSDGLSEHEVRARFLRQRAEFEKLRSMVQDDAETSDLRFVSANAADQARCGTLHDDQPCLAEDRRSDYARRMRRAGVLWIDRERDPARTYFVLYYRSILMDARLRGVVYAPVGVDVGRLKPHQEWRTVSEGWHSYLMIDS